MNAIPADKMPFEAENPASRPTDAAEAVRSYVACRRKQLEAALRGDVMDSMHWAERARSLAPHLRTFSPIARHSA